jgi:soluble lytic murein transglycosylase-like protein
VLEIGPGGAVTVYDRPSVFSASGVAPIAATTTDRRAPRTTASVRNQGAIASAARQTQLSSALIEAVAWRESRGTPGLVSPAGAIGEMQLMPSTARRLGVDPADSLQNYRGGAAYLQSLMRRYDGDLIRTLAAYNAGPGAVDRYGGIPPFRETQAYVAAILDRLSAAADNLPQAGSTK